MAMEDESLAGVEAAPQGLVLNELAANETSLVALAKTLLSPRTLPHLALIVVSSTMLYFIANSDGGEDFAALGFISLALGYALTAMFSTNHRIRSWIALPEISEKSTASRVKRFFSSFKICIFPLSISLALGVFIIVMFSQDSATDLPAVFPVGLASLFVIWAIAQGVSFSTWASSISAKKLPNKELTSGNLVMMTLSQFLLITALSVTGIWSFDYLYESRWAPYQSLISNAGFLALALGSFAVTVYWTWTQRMISMKDKALKKFTKRWTLFAHVFATWHLLTVWRQIVMSQQSIEIFIEEVLLMMFTVFMAIWSLTSKSVGKEFKLLSNENALPWGLAFGYAYAGSVAMLATALNDITYVMVSGHIIAFLTITWMHSKILKRVLAQHDVEIEVQRIVHSEDNSKAQKSVVEEQKTPQHPTDNVEQKPVIQSTKEEVWQEDEDVKWDGEVGKTIGEDVEWSGVIDIDD